VVESILLLSVGGLGLAGLALRVLHLTRWRGIFLGWARPRASRNYLEGKRSFTASDPGEYHSVSVEWPPDEDTRGPLRPATPVSTGSKRLASPRPSWYPSHWKK